MAQHTFPLGIKDPLQRRSGLPGHAIKRHFRAAANLAVSAVMLAAFLLSPLASAPVQAAALPVLLAPASGATITVNDAPPLAIPEFRWSAADGATQYRIQIASDIAFTTKVVDATTENTSYTPIVATLADGTWYWRVRVEKPTIGDFTAFDSFIKQWASPDNKPILSFPAASSTVDFYDKPVFSWSTVTGASKYKLQVYTAPGGWSSLALGLVTTLAPSYQPLVKLANGTYYWRVIPVDGGGHDGTPSDERSFNAGYNPVPTLLAPANLATPTFTPTFSWTTVRGAQTYTLQYSTDPSFSTGNTVTTHNTSFTPTTTLPNDVNYYWRVKVTSGVSITDWTQSFSFIKKWYIKPVLLTPTNNYQHVRLPMYSWTPVPGAAYYHVEIATNPNFNPLYTSGDTANTFYTPVKYDGTPATYYWRVTPYDGNAQPGVASNTASYFSSSGEVAPEPAYPLYYYLPDTYAGYPGLTTTPHEDRTVSQPIFMWHRVYKPAGGLDAGGVYAEAYRLQVSTDATFTSVNWTVDTENTVATPSAAHPFTPGVNTDYYWRVRPLVGGVETGSWSQVWKARFDPSKRLTSTASPSLITPVNGFEESDTTPLLCWFPIIGATSYDVQISSDPAFASILDSATVSDPAYAPLQSLAQRNLGDVNFGVYYWRVRMSPAGAWSETRHFQIAAPSEWLYSRTSGAPANRLQIGTDPAADVVGADYDVTDLQAAQSKDYWFFGFHVPSATTNNVTYALYLDLDHQDGSGATFDAMGYSFNTISSYRPEYAIYVLQEGGAYAASKVYVYHWNGIGWDTVSPLDAIGGSIYTESGYVELKIPNTAIGYQDTTGSYAISLLSLPAGGSGMPMDSVPSDPNVPGAAPVSRFANVTERMNLLFPPNDAGVDTTTYPSNLPFMWDYTVHAPWSGAIMKAYLDAQLTTEVGTYTLTSDTSFYSQIVHAWDNDFRGDNSYYWRVQPRYRDGFNLISGAWSQPARFERAGFVAQNLSTSVSFATPTFSWSMVEGAENYALQVSTDPNFGTTDISLNTSQTSYTPTISLAPGVYSWRVRVNRHGGVINDWSDPKSFTLTLPVPAGLNTSPTLLNRAPTLCWTPVVNSPVFAAWEYQVQISKEPNFTPIIWETVNSTEQSCYTPIKAYDDGNYYWRVAAIDGDGHVGTFSSYQTVTKQYPTPTNLSPSSGANSPSTPTFSWSPVTGAKQYRFEVSLTSNFASLVDSVTTYSARYTPVKAYANNTYYWRVAMIDDAGKYGPFQGSSTIINPNVPGAFTKLTPSNGNTTQLSQVTLSWTTSAAADSYQYCFGTSNPCSNWTSTGALTSVGKSGLLPSTTYYWNVKALNSFGESFADGSATDWSFSTDAIGIPTLTSISPNKKYADSISFTLTVNGSGFWSGDTVYWNGALRTTTFVSPTQLTATIQGTDMTALDLASVSVMTPSLQESNALQFNVYTFYDVVPGSWYYRYVEGFYAKKITTGCNTAPYRYCPDRAVTRAEMAVFILRALHMDALPYIPTPSQTGMFADVPVTGKEWMQPWIEEFYGDGYTNGCGYSGSMLMYCPERQVTRAEMAVFVLRAIHGASYQPPAVTVSSFSDVPVAGKEWMMPWMEEFYVEGLTTGCKQTPTLQYCPEQSVNRAEMATFLDRAFGIPQLP